MRTLCSGLGLLGTLALAIPVPAAAQALGSEFQVNTYTTGRQTPGFFFIGGNVAADADGDFVIVWKSQGQDGKGWGIFGQRYDATGAPAGAEFRVNSLTAGNQNYPSVASDAAGNFVVVWDAALSGYGRGDPPGCFGQRYDAAGVPQGRQFRIKDSGSNARFPAVASAADGNFVVAWVNGAIFGQRFDGQGVAQGRQVKVNGAGVAPAVASDSAGNFVVVWAEPGSGYGGGDGYVFGQRFDRDGVPQGHRFEIDRTFLNSVADPAVAFSANGTFVVVWSDFDSYGGDGYDVFGQRYDSDGSALGARFQVNSYTTDQQEHPSVASDASGNFLVAWQDRFQDGSGRGVFGQRYDSDGVARGGEFRVNTFTAGDQRNPSASAVGTNRFVVVWASDNQDGSDEGVFGQRYDFDGADATTVGSPNARYP